MEGALEYMAQNRKWSGKQGGHIGNDGGRVRISQCMIVKNEEKNIRQALTWGKSIMYEQIVVDTGSTDRTVELAKELGAKVYHFDWINDFSAAKNFAIEKAKGDWVAFLDADEYMTEEWAVKLPGLLDRLHQTSCIMLSCPWVNLRDDGVVSVVSKQRRVFRWLPELRYHNAVHENLFFQGYNVPVEAIYDTGEEFPIYHTGYAASNFKEKNKNERNRTILLAELEKNPNNSDIMGYLGDVYKDDAEKKEEAVSWFRKAVSVMPQVMDPLDERSALTFIYLLELLAKKNDEPAFWEIYNVAKEKMPWVYDLDYIAARFLIVQGAYDRVLYHMQQTLNTVETYGDCAYGLYLYANIEEFWEDMAVCYYETGNLTACVKQCVSLLNKNRHRSRTLSTLLLALTGEKPEAVLHFLNSLYDLNDIHDRIFVMKAAIQVKATAFLEAMEEICTPEEQTIIEQARDRLE